VIKQKLSSIRVDSTHHNLASTASCKPSPAAISIYLAQQTRDSTRHEKKEEEKYHAS
jgi:hypothetical protein